MNRYLKIGHRLFDGEQIIAALAQYRLLDSLIGQVLVDAVLDNIPLTRQEVFRSLIGDGSLPLPENFDAFLERWCQIKGVTSDYFNTIVLRELRMEKFKQLQFADRVESEFLRSKPELDRVEYSLIRIADLALAQELYFQLRDDGASFSELAQQHSLGNERQAGGWVGPVSLATLPAEVAALFKNDQPATLYGPIPVGDLFWIVRLEQFIVARLTEATRIQLINRLYDQWLQAQVQEAMNLPGAIALHSQTLEPTSTLKD